MIGGGLGRSPEAKLMTIGETDFIPTRSSLLSRLQDWEDAASWQKFFNTSWKLIYNTAIKAGLSDA